MSARVTAEVVSATETEFQLRNFADLTWKIREEDRGRIKVGDVMHLVLPNGVYPLVSLSQITESDLQEYEIVDIIKGDKST